MILSPRCKVTPQTVSQLALGELTAGAGSCSPRIPTACSKQCFARSALVRSVHDSEAVSITHLLELKDCLISTLVVLHVVRRFIFHYAV